MNKYRYKYESIETVIVMNRQYYKIKVYFKFCIVLIIARSSVDNMKLLWSSLDNNKDENMHCIVMWGWTTIHNPYLVDEIGFWFSHYDGRPESKAANQFIKYLMCKDVNNSRVVLWNIVIWYGMSICYLIWDHDVCYLLLFKLGIASLIKFL